MYSGIAVTKMFSCTKAGLRMTSNKPVNLIEAQETGDRFLVYRYDRTLRPDIFYEVETLWMTWAQIAQLFSVDRTLITKHIVNVYAEGELDPEATSAKIAQVRQEFGHVQSSGSSTITNSMQ